MLLGYILNSDHDIELSSRLIPELDTSRDLFSCRQLEELLKAGVDPERIYEDKAAPNKIPRPQLKECLKALREGDVLVVYRLERLGRSLRELADIVDTLKAKRIELLCISEEINTATLEGKLFFHVFAAVTQFEGDIISERTKAGLRAARARGKSGGRKPKLSSEQVRLVKAMMADPDITHQEVADHFGVSRVTLYRSIEREKNRIELDDEKSESEDSAQEESAQNPEQEPGEVGT